MYGCRFVSGGGRAPMCMGGCRCEQHQTMHIYAQAIRKHTHTHPSRTSHQHARTHKHTQPHTQLHMDTPTHIHASAQTHPHTQADTHTHRQNPLPKTFNRDTSTVQVCMRTCGRAVCRCGLSGGLFAFIDGMWEGGRCMIVFWVLGVGVRLCREGGGSEDVRGTKPHIRTSHTHTHTHALAQRYLIAVCVVGSSCKIPTFVLHYTSQAKLKIQHSTNSQDSIRRHQCSDEYRLQR